MSDMSQKPISSLARECMEKPMEKEPYGYAGCGYGWWFYLFWFLIVGVIVWFLLFALKPDFVQKDDDDYKYTGEVDQGKVLLWAVIIALIAVFLIWIFQWGFTGAYW